jgi:hypothetical protein
MAAAKLSLESVYFVWLEQDIMFKRNAISFDPTLNLSNTTGTSRTPAMAAFENNVYVVWDDDTPGNSEILYRKSTDGGASFGDTVNLSNTTGRSSGPAVAVSGSNVYVVWDDDTPGNYEILYRRSTDGGVSFGGTVNLSNTTGTSVSPAMAVSENNVYVVWMDHSLGNFDILFRRSTDGGVSFGGTVNLSNTSQRSDKPDVAAFGDIFLGQSVCVVWSEDTPPGVINSEILYRKSTDGGASFGGPVNLSNTGGRSRNPAVITSMVNLPQQDMYVVWTEDTPGGYSGIHYRKSTDGGASFGRNMYLDSYYGSYEVAVSGNNVYFVYAFPVTGNYEIFYKKSTDGGASFGRPVNLSNTTVNSGSPRVAASSNLSL